MTPQQKNQALVWTGAQYVLLAVLVFGGRIFVPSVAGWTLIGIAFGLTGWALIPFRATRLRITPMVAEGGTLIISGPYRWIRHPMYASVLLAVAGCVILDSTPLRIIALFLLLPTLHGKLTVEEGFLREAYPDYAEYSSRTKRIVPFVW